MRRSVPRRSAGTTPHPLPPGAPARAAPAPGTLHGMHDRSLATTLAQLARAVLLTASAAAFVAALVLIAVALG